MKKTEKLPKEERPRFDYDKTWYLLPAQDQKVKKDFFGLLHEGSKLHDTSAFRRKKEGRNDSRTRIAGFDHIFRYFSEPYVFAVKVDKRTRVERSADRHFWYASKVTVMAVMNCWELFSHFCNIYKGDINLEGQPYIPEGLVFPTVLHGDLLFSHAELPSRIRLPSVVDGELKIGNCNIPGTWKLPARADCLNLIESSFSGNLDFRSTTIAELHITNCVHPPRMRWPRVFPGRLTIAGEKIKHPAFFPEEVSDLLVNGSSFEKGAVLPEIIYDSLTFVEVTIDQHVCMPRKCKVFTAIETKFPGDFSFPAGLQIIELIQCKLSEEMRLPGSKPVHLIFKEMDIPSTLNFPKQFKGSLEFIHCRLPAALELPGSINGRLLFGNCSFTSPLKIPVNKACQVSMYEGDETGNLVAPESKLKRIKFEKDPKSRDKVYR